MFGGSGWVSAGGMIFRVFGLLSWSDRETLGGGHFMSWNFVGLGVMAVSCVSSGCLSKARMLLRRLALCLIYTDKLKCYCGMQHPRDLDVSREGGHDP